MKRSIVWFKTDLRLHDNETLIKAISEGDEVLPVYCLDDQHFGRTSFGFRKTGSFRAKFLLETLADLDRQLRQIGSGLMILRGDPAEELPNVAKAYGVSVVFSKREVVQEEKLMEDQVREGLATIGCSLETVDTSTLYHPDDLPFPVQNIPNVFTEFRKKTEQKSSVRPLVANPEQLQSPEVPLLVLPQLEDLGLTPPVDDSRKVIDFHGGETEGLKRLEYYFSQTKLISSYKATRNGMIGGDYSSKLSAWLALGSLSPRRVYHELKRYEAEFGANESTYWLVFELLWRDYFRFMMEKYGNRFFMRNGIKSAGSKLMAHDSAQLHKWINGETGSDFVDANMLELKLTGYMSARGRQNVASYLVNDLKQDWRYGAAYFEQQLIDHDVCSNWGNWAYVAGVGNDPRGNRYFNIEKQANDYDPDGVYRERWLRLKG